MKAFDNLLCILGPCRGVPVCSCMCACVYSCHVVIKRPQTWCYRKPRTDILLCTIHPPYSVHYLRNYDTWNSSYCGTPNSLSSGLLRLSDFSFALDTVPCAVVLHLIYDTQGLPWWTDFGVLEVPPALCQKWDL